MERKKLRSSPAARRLQPSVKARASDLLRVSERRSSPTSASSEMAVSGVQDLHACVADIMEGRGESLKDLRRRISDLSDLQQREESEYRRQMEAVRSRAHAAIIAERTNADSFEKQLRQEQQQRAQLLEMVSAFKEEGAVVVHGLKESLRQLTQKWQSECRKNEVLGEKLRALQGRERVDQPLKRNAKEAEYEAALQSLTQLLEEEDAVIVELRGRNAALEGRVEQLLAQRDRLLDERSHRMTSKECSAELQSLQSQASAFSQPATLRDALSQIAVYRRLGEVLGEEYTLELQQRLRVEEQSARMAEQQDRLIQTLEERLRDVRDKNPVRRRVEGTSGDIVVKDPDVRPSSGHAAEVSEQVLPKVPPLQLSPHTPKSHVSDRHAIPTPLEDRLAAVTAAFQNSLAQWSEFLDGHPRASCTP